MNLDVKELESIIKNGDFNKIKGICESDVFDCKREVYNLKLNSAKFELAKDVTAFANAGEGFILIGIETKRSGTSHCDEIVSIHPFEQKLCNSKQYLDVLAKWIYPKLKGIEAKWYPTKENPNKGIFVIKIPPQSKIYKPFLISRTILESKKLCEVLFGYCERKQESNDPKSIVELHQVLRDGLNYSDNLNSRLKSIEIVLDKVAKLSPPLKNENFKIEKKINDALLAVGMSLKRAMILTACPDHPENLKTLFSSNPQSMKSKLENPPKIRERGFGLRVLDRARIINGNFCRVTGGDRKVIDLYRDGVLVAALKADESFLCWGMKTLTINPVALVESVYNFMQLYELVIQDMDEKPKRINIRFDFRNFHLDDKKNILAAGGLNDLGFVFMDDIRYAPHNNLSDYFEINTEDFEIDVAALGIMERIYLYFGFELEAIPYTKEREGKKYIDIEKIQSL